MSADSASSPLSHTSSRSSRSSMRIDMPPPPSAYIHASPPYIIAPSPSPSQDPANASWHLPFSHHHHNGADSSKDSCHSHGHGHRIHIATPHPLAATAEFLDKHVPLFAKHHTEYRTNHDLRAAKREARHSVVDSPIPEVDVEHHSGSGSGTGAVAAAIHAATATGAAPSLADGSAAWKAVMAQREAERLRSGGGGNADGESLNKSMGSSPAVTP